jgi:hypothetical protein
MQYRLHGAVCVCGVNSVAQVIYMAERKPIPPKTATFEHGGQRYTCRFDPNAPPDKRWVWTVAYTRTYQYFGHASTMEGASSNARRQIHKLNVRRIKQEEDDG